MTVVHFLLRANTGGIEVLCKNYTSNSRHRNIVVCFWSGGCIADEMKENGVEVIELNANKSQAIGIFRKIERLCVKEKVDAVVVHHESPLLHAYALLLKLLHPRLKTIAYAHCNAIDMYTVPRRTGDVVKKKKSLLRRIVLSLSLNFSTNVVAISESVSKSIQKVFGAKKRKIKVIYNGVSLEDFESDNKPDISNGLKLMYVGRLIAEKGVQVTLKGLAQLPQSIPWTFTVVGEGTYKKNLEHLATELGIADRVSFLGNCRNVPELLKKADFFLHLPIWEEGFGITIVEAMASGKICICSHSGALSELISNNKTGYLIEKENPQALSEKLIEIYQSTHSASLLSLSENAKKRARDFSLNAYVENFDRLIEQ